jgi:beta-lactam-binding protein with PASTA domain
VKRGGRVISQKPRPGKRVAPRSAVKLTVSKACGGSSR